MLVNVMSAMKPCIVRPIVTDRFVYFTLSIYIERSFPYS